MAAGEAQQQQQQPSKSTHGMPRPAPVAEPLQPVSGPAVWTAADWENNKDWEYRLTSEDIKELEAAIAHIKATKKDLKDTVKADFPLPRFGEKLEQLLDEVLHGRGFQLLKGVPVNQWPYGDCIYAYWGMSLHWGRPNRQNARGHLLGHVYDINPPGGHHNPVNRVYSTHGAQPYHVDPCDVVGLLCLKTAKQGGESYWTSSWAIHNQLLKEDPEVVKCLAGEWYVDRKNEIPEGKGPFYKLPIFNYHKDHLCVFYENGFYQIVERHEEVPRLTPMQWKALDAFEKTAHDPKLRMHYILEPGDIQLLHNHQIVHARTEYEDYTDEEKKRHLLRIWLSPSNDWDLPEGFGERYNGTVVQGERGGIVVPGVDSVVAFRPGKISTNLA